MNRYEDWKLAGWREVDRKSDGSLIAFGIEGPDGQRETLQFCFDIVEAVNELLGDCLDEIIAKAVANRDAGLEPPTI